MHQLAFQAAVAGAEAIRAVSRDALATRDKGGVEDFVTAADHASERAILEVIRVARPDDSILAEESGVHSGTSSVEWFVDPLDGTSNFVKGSPDYAVSIAAHFSGMPSAAIIYRPADDLWLATVDGDRLHGTLNPGVGPPIPLAQARVSVSRPHEPGRYEQAMKLRESLLPLIAEERRTGAATWSLLLVATGGLDAYISVDIPLWDTAAGHRLVELAGGKVVTVCPRAGFPISIAGVPAVVDEIASGPIVAMRQ